jgi:diketogulonate reductase-like aldo/keto reductase
MDYVDLLIMHYPCLANYSQPRDGCSRDEGQEQRLDTWRALQEILASGKARAIGVSNYRQCHLEALLSAPNVSTAPLVNQVEWHLGYHNDSLLEYCKAHNITLQAYSPLGGGGTSTGRNGKSTKPS